MPTLTFVLWEPIPSSLAPERVVQTLHRYEPLITPNPFLVSYSRRPVDLTEIVDDPFFRDDGQSLAAFEVVDRVVLVPGLASKQVVIPCVMQRFVGGLRCRSFAAGGVRVWSTWKVMALPPDDDNDDPNQEDADPNTPGRAVVAAPPPTPPATPPTLHKTTSMAQVVPVANAAMCLSKRLESNAEYWSNPLSGAASNPPTKRFCERSLAKFLKRTSHEHDS